LDLPVQAFSPAIELVVQPEPPEQDFDVTVCHHRAICSLNVLFGKRWLKSSLSGAPAVGTCHN
jgi:hypothetical protein